jgi:hypothetical protein
MQGVPLIRSYGAQTMCIREFIHRLDEHNRPYSVMLAINMWAAMKIDSVVVALISLFTISMLFVHRSESYLQRIVTFDYFHYFYLSDLPSSDLGLLLAYSLALIGNVQGIFRLFVDVMIQVNYCSKVHIFRNKLTIR